MKTANNRTSEMRMKHEHQVGYIFRHAGWVSAGASMPGHWSHECACGFVMERVPVYPTSGC